MFLVGLWHRLGLVFIKVCRSGHYPFWLRAANSQWEPSGLQCSQPSPGIAGFAVRKKVSCEQAHLVRVSGALHWFVTQPHEDARKLGKKCRYAIASVSVIFTESGLKSSSKSRLVSAYVRCNAYDTYASAN